MGVVLAKGERSEDVAFDTGAATGVEVFEFLDDLRDAKRSSFLKGFMIDGDATDEDA